jgi:hypothetical protein
LQDLDTELVTAAFVGRTSTYELQDPTLSIPRQVGEVMERKPSEFGIAAYFWDIESGRAAAGRTRARARS